MRKISSSALHNLYNTSWARVFLSNRRILILLSGMLCLSFIIYRILIESHNSFSYRFSAHLYKNAKPTIDRFLPNKAFELAGCKYCQTDFFKDVMNPTLKIEMQHDDFISMMNERKKGLNESLLLSSGQWTESPKNFHNATVKLNNEKKNKGKIKLIGMNLDQFGISSFFSFRIKLKQEDRIFHRKTLNTLIPFSRNFTKDFLANIVYQKLCGGIRINYLPVEIIFNKEYQGTYFVEDFFDKYLMENNHFRESIIFESAFGNEFIKKEGQFPNNLNYGDTTSSQAKHRVDSLFSWFNTEHKSKLFPLIDYEKMISFISIGIVNSSLHHALYINNHWYYNSVTNKLEPTLRELEFINETSNSINFNAFLKNTSFDRYEYYKHYIKSSPIIFGAYINYFTQQNVDIYRDIDDAIFNAISIYQETLKSEEYYTFIKQLGIRNARYVTRVERNMDEVMSIFLTSFEQQPLKTKLTAIPKKILFTHNLNITQTITIPENETWEIQEGVKIILSNNANLLVYGNIQALGKKSKPIIFSSQPLSNSSIFIHSDTAKSNIFNYTVFEKLSNLKEGFWNTPAAINVYESKVAFTNCTFKDNVIGDDFINIFRTKDFTINQCSFSNTVADAIDTDFSIGTIQDCTFTKIGNDAIDCSGSNVNVKNTTIEATGDKAISSGEKSTVNVENTTIKNCAIGLVSKDESLVQGKNLSLQSNKMDICVFQKKPEFGAAALTLDKWERNHTYLFQKGSRITINNDTLKEFIYIKDIESKLYGHEYGKASK